MKGKKKCIKDEDKIYICPHCRKKFIDKKKLTMHLKKHHNLNIKTNDFGKEDLSILTAEYFKKYIDKSILTNFSKMIKDVYFNENNPKNFCIYVKNINTKNVSVKKNGIFIYEILDKVIMDLIKKFYYIYHDYFINSKLKYKILKVSALKMLAMSIFKENNKKWEKIKAVDIKKYHKLEEIEDIDEILPIEDYYKKNRLKELKGDIRMVIINNRHLTKQSYSKFRY